MYEIVIVFLLLVSIAIVALILVQQGKGAGMGASFGAGASNTVFGSAGSGNFLTRSTWTLAILFFGICLLIGYLQKQDNTKTGDFTNIDAAPVAEQSAPAPADVPTIDGDVPAVSTEEMTSEMNSDVPVVESDATAETDAAVVETDTAATAETDAAAAESDTAAEAEAATEPETKEDAEIKAAIEESNNEPEEAK